MNTRCWCTGPTVSLDDCSHSASGSDRRFAILPHTVAEALVFSRVLRLQLPELPLDLLVIFRCCEVVASTNASPLLGSFPGAIKWQRPRSAV